MDEMRHRWLDPGVPAERDEWMALLGRCRHDFHHLPAFAVLEAERLDGQARALVVERGPDAALLSLILRPLPPELGVGGWDARSPEGFPAPLFISEAPAASAAESSGFPAAAIERFVVAMRERELVAAFLRLHPLIDTPLDACERFSPVVTHGPTVWIDLEADEAAQWADSRPLHRRQVRRAQREGVSVHFGSGPDELDAFFAVYAETMRRVDASWDDFGRPYIAGLMEAVGERGFFAIAQVDGQSVSGGLFTRSCGIAQYHLGGTFNAWLRISPLRLVIDEVRRRCTALGDRQLHLGGGVGTRQDSLFEFKCGFSSRRASFRSWRLVVDEARHAQLVERWRERGGTATGFFPLYRAPLPA